MVIEWRLMSPINVYNILVVNTISSNRHSTLPLASLYLVCIYLPLANKLSDCAVYLELTLLARWQTRTFDGRIFLGDLRRRHNMAVLGP